MMTSKLKNLITDEGVSMLDVFSGQCRRTELQRLREEFTQW
jgi:hypothetical protein